MSAVGRDRDPAADSVISGDSLFVTICDTEMLHRDQWVFYYPKSIEMYSRCKVVRSLKTQHKPRRTVTVTTGTRLVTRVLTQFFSES